MSTPMTTAPVCETCGAPLAGGRCAVCEEAPQFRFIHREIVLLVVLSVIAVCGFLLTRKAAASTRESRLADAATWFRLGQEQLQGGHAEQAVDTLRRALAVDRENRRYRLTLANALGATHRVDETRQVLLRLREGTPEDPEVNIELARLEARQEHVHEAVAYYQNALYGRWNTDAFEERRHLRIELIRYLLQHGDQRRALSELLVLSANLPDGGEWRTITGQLFLEAGDPRRALGQFTRVLAIAPTDANALAGAGQAAVSLGDYAAAQRYLRAAPRELDHVADSLRLANMVLSNDPLGPRLPLAQRRSRLTANLEHAVQRLDRCRAAPSGSSPDSHQLLEALRVEASDLEPALEPERVREAPEAIEAGVNLTFRIEQATSAAACGPADELDEALVRIGRRHSTDQP